MVVVEVGEEQDADDEVGGQAREQRDHLVQVSSALGMTSITTVPTSGQEHTRVSPQPLSRSFTILPVT